MRNVAKMTVKTCWSSRLERTAGRIKRDADLIHSLLQYVLGVLHQLLHFSEHVVQTERTSLQGVPQGQRLAGRQQKT